MSSFYINNKKTDEIRDNQVTRKKQEENIARERTEKAIKNPSLQNDTVTISDEAKLIINSQLGKLNDSDNPDRMLMSATDADQLVKQVRKAQGEMDDEMEAKEKEQAKNLEGDVSAKMGVGGAEEEEEVTDPLQVKIDALKSQIDKIQEQVQEKQGQLQELVQDGSPEAKEKIKMIQTEVSLLSSMLNEYNDQLNELLEGKF